MSDLKRRIASMLAILFVIVSCGDGDVIETPTQGQKRSDDAQLGFSDNGSNTGLDGTDGVDGTDGTDGTDGVDGTSAEDGTDGTAGHACRN